MAFEKYDAIINGKYLDGRSFEQEVDRFLANIRNEIISQSNGKKDDVHINFKIGDWYENSRTFRMSMFGDGCEKFIKNGDL